MIEIKNLTMRFGPLLAVDRLSLSIPKGEFFAFLGPNGAGKTTTIRMLAGLMKPMEGEIQIDGIDLLNEPVKAKSRMGYVPDVAIFYDRLTSKEFMEFIADVFGMDLKEAEKKTDALFTRFALHSYANQQIEHLSHGTRQRLAIASALLHDPQVIIIDEPMVGLDPLHARVMKQELKARSLAGTTVLMSTHLLNIAEELADRIGIMHRGKLVAIGTMEELRNREGRTGQMLEEIFLDLVTDQERAEDVVS